MHPAHMSLSAGSFVGPYEIVGKLGEGGMGEVYRARDSKLGRDVALKILPADVAADRDRITRFEREARTLAALNHPHIAQIYGLVEGPHRDGDPTLAERALVMELVDGEDLADRIAHGAIPLDEALPIATQTAEALEAAHDAGIVHRDLKPANIKLRADGTVKVLDFGLAKSSAPGAPGSTAATFTSPAMTQAGVILGTAAYMSPEQARGKPVDKRTDIWAFGCVVYEMLAGRPAFEGETVTDVLSAIVRSDPDWDALPPNTPPALQRILRRCLQKDAAKRLRDAGDFRIEIEEIASETDVLGPPVPAVSPRRARARLVLASVAVLILVAMAASALTSRLRPTTDARVQKLSISVGGNGLVREPMISPDGTKVAFVAPAKARLSVRTLDQWNVRELEGTEGAVRPFWSPDSQWIAYFRNEQLLKVPAAGGPVVRVAAIPAVQVPLRISSGAWTDDGTITIAIGTGGLFRVSAGGGDLTALPVTPPENKLLMDVRVLPTGALLARLDGDGNRNSIVVVDGDTTHIVYEGGELRRPAYAPPGYLIYSGATDNSIWAMPFDLDRLAVTGEPFLITTGTEASVDRHGTLAFVPFADVPRDLAWFDLEGRAGPRLAEPRQWIEGAAVSRDGRRVLASTSEGIWAYDVETGARSRVTTGTYDITPQWLDANTMLFVRTESLQPVVVLKDLRPSGSERVLARRARFPRVTANGQRIVFNLQDENRQGGWVVAWIDVPDFASVHRLPELHFGARFPTVSPDGTLVAYVSGEVGRDEIYLTRLPGGEGKWQISTSGGGWALFHPSGNSVVYRTPDNVMMSVPVSGREDVKVGLPQKLFDWGGAWAPFYDFSADGKRGIAALPLESPAAPPSISIIQNWALEFR
jgi:eukaryotic-like serine/threonine-protein kinase